VPLRVCALTSHESSLVSSSARVIVRSCQGAKAPARLADDHTTHHLSGQAGPLMEIRQILAIISEI